MPAQHAAAVDDPRVQVASQQKVELLQKQRNGQADSEEAERAAIEEEGAHAHAHAPQRQYRKSRAAGDWSLGPNPQRVRRYSRGLTHTHCDREALRLVDALALLRVVRGSSARFSLSILSKYLWSIYQSIYLRRSPRTAWQRFRSRRIGRMGGRRRGLLRGGRERRRGARDCRTPSVAACGFMRSTPTAVRVWAKRVGHAGRWLCVVWSRVAQLTSRQCLGARSTTWARSGMVELKVGISLKWLQIMFQIVLWKLQSTKDDLLVPQWARENDRYTPISFYTGTDAPFRPFHTS